MTGGRFQEAAVESGSEGFGRRFQDDVSWVRAGISGRGFPLRA